MDKSHFFYTFLDELVLVLRNPYLLLVEMQLKQAALAANNYEADVFGTEKWKNFAISGVKAWYAHTRGWLCSKVKHITLVHYEILLLDFNRGK